LQELLCFIVADFPLGGFGGADKVFLMSFSMPYVGIDADSTKFAPIDMPAIWMLNSKIVRTGQYNEEGCNCWPACGEFDVAEALTAGSSNMTASLHGNQGATPPDYLERSVSTTTLAVIFQSSTQSIQIQTVPSGSTFASSFPSSLTTDNINTILDINQSDLSTFDSKAYIMS
jgi:hypothetical protein